MIAATAVESLLNRLPDVEMRVPFKELSWVPAPWSRQLVTVPIRYTPHRAVRGQGPAGGAAVSRSARPVARRRTAAERVQPAVPRRSAPQGRDVQPLPRLGEWRVM